MSANSIIDVHCHLFNAKYALEELAAITWNTIRGRYPHYNGTFKTEAVSESSIDKSSILDSIEGATELIAYVARLVKVCIQDCNSNYTYMVEMFNESNLSKKKQLICAPLMMDIFYALDNNKSDIKSLRMNMQEQKFTEQLFVVEDNEKDAFEKHLENLKNELLKEMTKNETALLKQNFNTNIESLFSDIKSDLTSVKLTTLKSDNYPGVEMSPGFKKHMEDLIELEKKYKGLVFPFLAVDPRRKGIMNLIKLKVNGSNGPFYGIKLYPPLGYLPTHPNLTEVYDYCIQNQIPITVHTSAGGVKNYRIENYVQSTETGMYPDKIGRDTDKTEFYTDPENWKPVLQKAQWNNLKINFAHFGGGEQYSQGKKEWMDSIRKLIECKDYPNLFTDLSYYTENNLVEKVISDPANKNILNKIMFGTDYVMIMLDSKLKGLKAYYNNNIPQNDTLLYQNANLFLKGSKSKNMTKKKQSVKKKVSVVK